MRPKAALKYLVHMITMGIVAASSHASVSYSGGTYSQNFDSLASSGLDITFTDDSTLPGWHAVSANANVVYTNGFNFSFLIPINKTDNSDAYDALPGGSSATELYSFGLTDASDRALGSISDQAKDYWHGLCIKNDTGSALSDFTLNYDGEQWRRSGSTVQQDLFVYYRIGGTEFDSSGTWTLLDDLTFTSPNTTGTGALDGNLPASRATLTQTIAQNVAAGENIWFAWVDLDYEGLADHGLAIDNVEFTATIPEPTTLSLVIISSALLIVARRTRR